jgi:serine/threonine-protein kinase HipA
MAARPAAERQLLLRWTIFQVLIGNTDAHAKNLSFFSGAGGLSLGPAYDLVCGLMYAAGAVADTYAFAIGDAFAPHELSTYEWAHFALLTKISPVLVQKELTKLANTALKVLPPVSAEAIEEGARPDVVESIRNQVTAECARQIIMTSDIPRVARDSF